jgi:hypothetical protein
MIEAFREGFDIHAATAAKIWHEENIEEVTPDSARKPSSANFGIIYGITDLRTCPAHGHPRGEARQLIDDYFDHLPRRAATTWRSQGDGARPKGYAETLFHRRRYLPDINSKNATVRNFAERNAINAPIQGSEADIIKVAMIRIFNRFKTRRHPLEDDSAGARRTQLLRLSRREGKGGADCSRRDAACLPAPRASRGRCRMGQQLARSPLKREKEKADHRLVADFLQP